MWDAPLEWLIVIVAVLFLFGSSKKIPEFARNLGRATGEFKKGQVELENQIRKAVNTPSPTTSSNQDHINYQDVARSMGIETENKNDDDLKKEISERLNSGQ